MSGLAEKLFERALISVKTKDWDAALRTLCDVVRFDPDMFEAWILRGNICALQERYLDAVLHYERALTINQDLSDAWNNLGTALSNLGMFEIANDAFRRAILAHDSWEPHVGLGNMYITLMDLQQAEKQFARALELDNCTERYFQIGCVQLGQGKWKDGFRGYAYRWQDNPQVPLARRALPQWNGESLVGKSIVLYPDQGYGDVIMCLRFAADYLDAEHVVLQMPAPLTEITKASLKNVEVIPVHGMVPHADYSCALLDVPMMLELNWDEVGHSPYLVADADRAAQWKQRLPQGFNVGVCWMSGGHFSTTLSIQRMKSIRVEMLRALRLPSVNLPSVNLVSLQKPIMEKVPPDLELIDYMDEIDDFADTAALIEALDLVITVDTAVAHVAGAIGKPVWNLVRFSGYWPWLAPDVCGTDKSIWYDCMRLYRQPRSGDWEQPMQRVASDLEALIQCGR
jgi:tetratricopeptide (TPR) repeat protein